MVITADTSLHSDKPGTFWGEANFDFVIATDLALHEMAEVNRLCREGGSKFFSAAVDGMVGMYFADLGVHDFMEYGSLCSLFLFR